MLRITIHDSQETLRFQLEGKLSGPWVRELEQCWRTTTSPGIDKRLIVDLTDTDFVDDGGKRLLATMHKNGVQFVTVTPLMSGVVSEISHVLVLFLSLAFASTGLAQQPLTERTPLKLSLARAVELAVSPEGNAHLQLADEGVKQAQSRSAQARAALLPNFDASVGQQNQTRNLAALGIRIDTPIPGFQFPTFVGPFNTFDVRSSVTQSIFNVSSIRRYQASKAGVSTAKSERGSTEDQVAARVAKAYLAALRAQADIDTVEANVALAKAVLGLAQNQKDAGEGTGIEVTRARVQLSDEEQRLLVAQNDRRRARLQLLREMGIRLDTEFELTDSMTYKAEEPPALEAVKAEALKSRDDWKAQQDRENQARIASSATKMERLPSISGFGDYGSIGSSINNALPTRTYGVT